MTERSVLADVDMFQVKLETGEVTLDGDLRLPVDADGVVLFAHGSGSSRMSPRNRFIANQLSDAGFASLLFDLLSPEEEARDQHTRRLRFDIELLARRLIAATDWIEELPETSGLPIGYFGASTGAAAAIRAATERRGIVRAIVSRGGRPDLAVPQISFVRAPTLLIVGGEDHQVLVLNQAVLGLLPEGSSLTIVPGAGHLFEEPGTLDQVARLAADWFQRYL